MFYKIELVFFGSPTLFKGFHDSTEYTASMCQSSVVNTQSRIETYKVKIRVLLKHYGKQDYKAAAVARRICQVEGEGVVSERVAQRWFQRFNTGEENTKDLPRSGRPKLWDIENISRVLEENPQKKDS